MTQKSDVHTGPPPGFSFERLAEAMTGHPAGPQRQLPQATPDEWDRVGPPLPTADELAAGLVAAGDDEIAQRRESRHHRPRKASCAECGAKRDPGKPECPRCGSPDVLHNQADAYAYNDMRLRDEGKR